MTILSTTVNSVPNTEQLPQYIEENLRSHYEDIANIYNGNAILDNIITKRPWVDVRAFGAIGDGVTDDTTAIQAAIDSVPNQAFVTVIYFSPGKFSISDTLLIRSGQRLVLYGAPAITGSDSTEILMTDSDKDMINASTALTNVFSMAGIQLTGAGQGTGTGNGLVLGNTGKVAFDSRIVGCWFAGVPDKCIYIKRAAGYHIYANGFDVGVYGIYIEDGKIQNALSESELLITNNRFFGLNKAGVFIAKGKNIQVSLNRFDQNGENNATSGGVVINNSSTENRNIIITNNGFNENFNDIVILGTADAEGNPSTGSTNTLICSNSSDNVRRSFIHANSADNMAILSNSINNASAVPASYGSHVTINVIGTSNGTVINGNVMTKQDVAAAAPTWGVSLAAGTRNTIVGDNKLHGATGEIVIASSATMKSFSVIPRVVQILTGAGAVNITDPITHLITASGGVAADAITLVDGVEGQEKIIVYKTETDAGDTSVLTPDNFLDGATITYDVVDQWSKLLFTNGSWRIIINDGTVA